MTKIVAPWTDEQVVALNSFQREGYGHPFTCGSGDRGDEPHRKHAEQNGDRDWGLLVAGRKEWFCPACGYTQNWAHERMTDPRALLDPLSEIKKAALAEP